MRDLAQPVRPEPQSMRLDRATTAVVVLDMSVRCDDPGATCFKLLDGLGGFLDRSRAAAVPIVFTVSFSAKGTPDGEVATLLKRRADEPVLYPNSFDKFTDGELARLLGEKGARNLVVTGSATNFAVMYTATIAARNHHYNVIIPLDGVNAGNAYEHEYALHQLSVLPPAATKIQFSTLSMITFA